MDDSRMSNPACAGSLGAYSVDERSRTALPVTWDRSQAPVVQELYDATTILIAALTFTHCTEDLLKPVLDSAIKRVIYARNAMRAGGIVQHRDAVLVPDAKPEHGSQKER